MPRFKINDGGTWRTASEIWLKDSGTWRSIKQVWAKKNGVWRQIFRKALELNIATDTADYDLFTAAGSPTSAVDIVLTVELDVVVYGSLPTQPAIYCSTALPAGSSLEIINKGYIYGSNGAGGDGGKYGSRSGKDGGQGGTAIDLPCNTTITNSVGRIFGGGGGGGGTNSYGINGNWSGGAGGGGNPGGQAGTDTNWTAFASSTWPTDGETSVLGFAAGGTLGYVPNEYHGYGGDCLGPGTYPTSSRAWSMTTTIPSQPGDLGRAVDRNGFSLTFSSGENADQLKGAYD